MVQDCETRTEGFLETHKKYIDVQVLINGEEMVYCDWGDKLETAEPYNEEKDYEFFKDREDKIEFKFAGGEFMILFPHDAHKPAMICGDKQTVCKKLVFKVKIWVHTGQGVFPLSPYPACCLVFIKKRYKLAILCIYFFKKIVYNHIIIK